MKTNNIHFLAFLFSVACLFSACEKSALLPPYEHSSAFQINIGDLNPIMLDQIAYYDKSSHLFYLNEELSIQDNAFGSRFWITSGSEVLLKGTYDQPFRFCDTTYLILTYGGIWNYPLVLELDYDLPTNMSYFSEEILPEKTEMISILKQNNKLMKGLDVTIASIERESPTHLLMNLEIYNGDTINYYYPDVDKMGFDFYHGTFSMFGLQLSENDSTHYYDHTLRAAYGDDELWYPTWLTLIKAGETNKMQISYNEFDSIQPGHYYAFFEFCGLKQHISTTREMLLDSGRVWLGSTLIAEEIEIK